MSNETLLTLYFMEKFQQIVNQLNIDDLSILSHINVVTLVDAFLILINVINVLISIITVIPPYHPLKKVLVKIHHKHIKKVHATPFLVTANNLLLIGVLAYFIYDVQQTSDMNAVLHAVVSAYTLIYSLVLQRLSNNLIILGYNRSMERDQEIDQHEIKNFKPISKSLMKSLVSPTETFISPDFTGMENIPKDTPALFVMNHSLYGIEAGSFVNGLYQERDVYVRGLADHFHFMGPYAELMRKLGGVDGTRDNVDCLMESKQNVLVYPGGGHEVLKHSSVPKYSLLWKQRLGFARLAIKHGYPIIPCASVGTEDMLDIIGDIPVGYYRKGLSIPIVGPVSPTRLQKVYFWIGEPISTSQYKGEWKNETYARELRNKTKAEVEKGIKLMQEKQGNDPDRFLLSQLGNHIHPPKDASAKRFKVMASKPLEDDTCNSENQDMTVYEKKND